MCWSVFCERSTGEFARARVVPRDRVDVHAAHDAVRELGEREAPDHAPGVHLVQQRAAVAVAVRHSAAAIAPVSSRSTPARIRLTSTHREIREPQREA